MKRYQRNRYSGLATINVTNLVDISLVLLVIFILAMPVIKEGIEIDVEVPEMTEAPSLGNVADPILVTIRGEDQVFLGEDPYPTDGIGEAVRREYDQDQTREILLRGDKAVAYGYVLEVMDHIQRCNIKKVTLETQPRKDRLSIGAGS